MAYSPGIYIRWAPDTPTNVDAETQHVLPGYCEDMMEFESAFILGSKTGFAGNPGRKEDR